MPGTKLSSRGRRALSGILVAAVLGTAGAASAAGFGFANFSAIISSSGAVAKSSGVKSASRTATGQYLVTFSRKINSCIYVAGPLGENGGQASATSVDGNKRQVKVSTFNKSGTAANRSFSLIVTCSS